MGLTVFAENMGLFHKGSNGTGIAPADVCLSPPTPPAGPVPIPYVNMLQASDLSNGSQTVQIDGNPTALEDSSFIATSSGDEPGTQGGNVVTHQTKGKGYFTLWSFTVKIEGKGVCRHGDMIGQNSASSPPGCIDAAAVTSFYAFLLDQGIDPNKPCPPDSKPPHRAPTDAQNEACRGGPCWNCAASASGRLAKAASGVAGSFKKDERFTPDHQPPQKAAWYMGGCHMKPSPDAFNKKMDDPDIVQPHCASCSSSQGGQMSGLNPVDGQITMGQMQALMWP